MRKSSKWNESLTLPYEVVVDSAAACSRSTRGELEEVLVVPAASGQLPLDAFNNSTILVWPSLGASSAAVIPPLSLIVTSAL